MDINLYLGYEHFSNIKNLKRGMSGLGGTCQASPQVEAKAVDGDVAGGCKSHPTLLACKALEDYSLHEHMFR